MASQHKSIANPFEEHPVNMANIQVVGKFERGCHQVQGIFIKSFVRGSLHQ